MKSYMRPVALKISNLSSPKMSSRSFPYVFLGGGNAAGYAASEFLKLQGKGSDLAIITDEPVVSYERPALSKAYLAPTSPARLPGFHSCVGGGGERQTPDWYNTNGITYLTNTKVVSVDINSKTLITSTDDVISYEEGLIIGTGARPVTLSDLRTPGDGLKGVFYLRNITTADTLVKAIQSKPAHAVVIGGGYIGLECSAMLSVNGIKTTTVFPESRVMERLLTPELAEFYESFYKSKNIEMVKDDLVTAVEGNDQGEVTGVVLKSGKKIDADMVLVGIGAKPNVELFQSKGLELLDQRPGGIKVNGQLETSVPGVYAVGDVCAFPLLAAGGTLVRQEHVTHARNSAKHAVRAMLGKSSGAEYDYHPVFFYSRVFNLSWQFYGFNEGKVVHFGDHSLGKEFGAYWVSDENKVVGVFLEGGSAEQNDAVKKVATLQPTAPGDLATQGLSFALSI